MHTNEKMIAALIKYEYGKFEYLPNPTDENEIKKILNCQNLGKIELKMVYTPTAILYYDSDEPDVDDGLEPLVNHNITLNKSKCLVVNIPEWQKLGFRNSHYTGCHLKVY